MIDDFWQRATNANATAREDRINRMKEEIYLKCLIQSADRYACKAVRRYMDDRYPGHLVEQLEEINQKLDQILEKVKSD